MTVRAQRGRPFVLEDDFSDALISKEERRERESFGMRVAGARRRRWISENNGLSCGNGAIDSRDNNEGAVGKNEALISPVKSKP
ncbi:hypothetical protein FOPE_10060 [Fonsecaea pedrosoi]|nr:hypothetical protein FOPE_10060 [Fonsecaea pedrosoi]